MELLQSPMLLLPVFPFSFFLLLFQASKKSLTLASGPLASVLESSWPILSLLSDGLSKPLLHLEIAASVALGFFEDPDQMHRQKHPNWCPGKSLKRRKFQKSSQKRLNWALFCLRRNWKQANLFGAKKKQTWNFCTPKNRIRSQKTLHLPSKGASIFSNPKRIRGSNVRRNIYIYQHLQRGAKWFLKGVNSPSLRV